MRRLLFIVNVDWFFLSHRLPLAIAAKEAGFEVHLAAAVTDRVQEIERHGIKVHPLNIDRRSANPMEAAKLLFDLFSLIRRVSPSVVHLVTIKPVLLGGLAARLARVPRVVAAISGLGFVFTARGGVARLRRLLVSSLYRLALSRNNVRVIFQNGDDQALLQRHTGIADAQVVRIRGSGVDLSAWTVQPLADGPPVVMMASRLLKDKGVVEFVEAARMLHGHRLARFVLVGSVDAGNPTSLRVEDLDAWVKEGAIEWWGQSSDMPAVLSMAHIVVLPSYREGLPKGLIEAAASGRAVVTTDVPGCRDAIEPGVSGVLVEVRNPQALADGIRGLLGDPERIKAMGAAGRRLAEQSFDVREVIARHLALYEGR
ncbi:glycosyltransferase family 4 protein [Pseudomonas sp. LS1212]|uniref:glycosyltransferase family 4 protein n=1 Tax=Pseudomonas sp. LS1212 TaxID=2972478 RepID=UPI00215CDAD0|nr:glycosyltransferase family 4 protein [Pseudomonas sp. LS1212]UVJ42788.1 glycosyltransferase family 4 protein [Pseudomonas sp. LS1212]